VEPIKEMDIFIFLFHFQTLDADAQCLLVICDNGLRYTFADLKEELKQDIEIL
jgi:hypothetical protein